MSEFNFACEKCPRTFKLEEFYAKHKKVHDLKKQHRCHICGFVYGAAKGLEGHIKTHDEDEEEKNGFNQDPEKSGPNPPYNIDFHFLNPRGVLAQAKVLPMASTSALTIRDDDEMSSPKDSPNKNGKMPSPSGTGSYEIFDSVPEVSDASTAVQNDSGFFMCSICSREFSGLNSLKKHIPIHTRRIQHRCDVCGYVFGKKEYLLDHMRKHTGEVSPVCEVCGQTFNKSLKLKEHFKLHRNTNASNSSVSPYQCHVCRSVFNRASILGSHLATAHAETVYKCDICEATFGDVRGKNHHMYNEHQLDAFHQKCVWCPVCNQGFTRHYNLKVHMYKSHGKEYIENNFSAAELAALTRPPPGSSTSGTAKSGKEQDSPVKPATQSPGSSLLKASPILGKHFFDTKNGTQMLTCQMCPEKFLRKSDLYIHLDSDHGVLLIGCTYCDDKFLDLLQLQDHVSSIHATKPKHRRPGPASRTNAPVESRANPNHITTKVDASPEGSQTLKCKDCIKVFRDRNGYVSHMRLIHGKMIDIFRQEDSAPVVEESEDEEDEEEIDANNPLAIIIKNLTEAAARKASKNLNHPESCNFCEKVFQSTNELKDHVINIHIKGFHFSCDLCGKAFPQQENLDAHKRAKHPNLAKRAQQLKSALGLSPSDDQGPPAKKSRLQGRHGSEQTGYSKPGPLSSKQNRAAVLAAAVQPPPAEEMEQDEIEEEYRFEPITEAFLFEDQIIHPCYVVLPYSSKKDIEKACHPFRNNGNCSGPNLMSEESLDEEVPLTIDETAGNDDEEEEISIPPPVTQKHNQRKHHINVEDLNLSSSHGFYPALHDFSLPFSMADLWKKKAELLGPVAALQQIELMEKVERMQKYNGSPMVLPPSPPPLPILPHGQVSPQSHHNNNNNKKSNGVTPNGTKTNGSPPGPKKSKKSMSPQKNPTGEENVFVTAYENQIQEDIWPLDCIKCNMLLGNLDNFNLHMNDHWSEDKCCPVCGLLINSKRFNFKQHLKIHTGEKPFVCAICNRSFRQKAHMVKHVTTHRGIPNSQEMPTPQLVANPTSA